MHNFLTIANNRFAPQLAVLLYSLLDRNRDKKFSVYVLTDHFFESNQEKIRSITDAFGSSIKFLRIDDSVFENLPDCGHISKYSYYRLIADAVLPRDIDRILYMDADIVVNGPVDELLTCRDIPLAAVKDYTSGSSSKRLGIEGEYFNAGVLSIDLRWFRDNRMSEVLPQTAAAMRNELEYADQDVLNAVFANKWKRIPVTNNFLSTLYKDTKKFARKYPEESTVDPNDLEAIKVIHYAGYRKPWRYSTDPLIAEYFNALRQTPFRSRELGYRINGYYRSAGSFLKNDVIRALPQSQAN